MFSTHFNTVEKIWSGKNVDFKIDTNKNFGEVLLENLAAADSDRVMQINGDTGETLTKKEVRKRTISCAQNLTKLGCAINDNICIIARNHHNLTPLLISAFCIGAPVSPLDVVIVKDGIFRILQRVEPKFVFCDADVLEMVQQILNDIGINAKLFTVNGSVDGIDSIDVLMRETGEEDSFVCTKLEDNYKHMAMIACSSGSTGLPKSISLSHALFVYSFTIRVDEFAFTSLFFSSLYWFSGVWSTITSVFKNTRVFTTQPFSADLFFDLVEKYKVHFFAGPPCHFQAFLKSERCSRANLTTLLVCISIGGYVPSILTQTLKNFVPHCKFMTTYGMTEVGGSGSMAIPNELAEYPNSVGQLVPGMQIKIISEITGSRCGIDEPGEIYLKNKIPPMGYYRDDEANKMAFDQDGFFITGDIGFFDEFGRLHISGRKKDIFKNCGHAIWPKEIEDILMKSPAINGVCVVSVYNDDILSDLPAAVVVKKDGYSITEEEVYALIADQLVSYKRLDGGVYFVDKMPMTPSDKVMRSQAQEIAEKLFQIRKQQKKSLNSI